MIEKDFVGEEFRMKSWFNKYRRWLFIPMCILIIIAGGVYYFGILCAFAPNAEDLMTTQNWYLILHRGKSYHHINMIFDMVSCLSVLIGGMSYFSVRLECTIFYMILLGLSLYLSVFGKREKWHWFLLPLWTFFMVFIHTVQDETVFSRLYMDSDLFLYFPYNYHIVPLIFALLSMFLLQCYITAGGRKKKIGFGGIGIIVGGYALLHTDLIYYVIFVVPLLIVLALRGLYHDKTRKYMMPLLAIGAGVMLLTRIIPIEIFEKVWEKETIGGSYGTIYGGTDFLILDNLILHVTNYIKVVMTLFNIELSNRPIISLYSVLFVVRLGFVVIGYVIVARIIAGSVRGKAGQNGYTMIDEILAWGFVMLSCAFVFTRNGLLKDTIRYYAALVPILTILLCRHIGSLMKSSLSILENMKHKRFYFAGLVCALCICQAEPIWMYEVEDNYREDCEAAIECLRQWGAEEGGYVLAPLWLAARMSAMTNGEIIFFADEQSIREIYGEEARFRYIVIGWDAKMMLPYGLYHIVYGSYQEMCDKYRAPIRTVELDYILYVCDFGDGSE